LEKEKLIIKNFGPIKEVDLDLGRFTILIGEQATGKSTVAKVLAVCRYFSYIVEDYPELHRDIFIRGLRAWGLDGYTNYDTYIAYYCNHYEFIYERFTYNTEGSNDGGETIQKYEVSDFSIRLIPKSENFIKLLQELEKLKPKKEPNPLDFDYAWTIPTSFYLNDVKNVLDNPFYLPTERGLQSIFSLGQGSLPNLESFLYNYFSKVDVAYSEFSVETEVEPLDILYINNNGKRLVKKKKESDFHLLKNAASGYQSTIPIVLVMKYQSYIRKRKKTFIIEEPELNLFPEAQYKLMEFLVDMMVNHENKMFITTHSPYTLTSLNNLMYAYQVGQTHPDKVSKEIDKTYWLNPDDVSAYMLKSDGSYEDIFDRDESLIKAEKIDEVSKHINKKFNAIMDIELGVDESTK
jgi:hypothetical protein